MGIHTVTLKLKWKTVPIPPSPPVMLRTTPTTVAWDLLWL